MPNIAVLPHRLSPYWKHAAWAHFKSEFAQFLDVLVDDGYKIKFLSMCRSPKENDDWAASEIIAHMSHRAQLLLAEQPQGIEQITQVISKYQTVITQRFHGIVLSEMTRVPCLALYHHDKLKPTGTSHGSFLSYYACSKQDFFQAFHSINHNSDDVLSIKTDTFEELNKEVISLLI
jgi:polysaccharide pyruvyl transferase WcaK-like protein